MEAKFEEGDIVSWNNDESYGAICEIEAHPRGIHEHDKIWVWNNDWFYPDALTLVCKAENREDR